DPAVGGHLADLGLPGADLVEGLGLHGGPGHGVAEAAQEFPGERPVIVPGAHTGLAQDGLGTEVAFRGVVLVQGMHRHPVHRGARRGGPLPPKLIMPLVGDADPIHRAEHHRGPSHHHDDAARPQAEVPAVGDRVVGQARAHRRRGVDVEEPHPQLGLDREHGPTRAHQTAQH
ncbi:MAG: hypothetical protein ACK559_10205, partial [bacterium]